VKIVIEQYPVVVQMAALVMGYHCKHANVDVELKAKLIVAELTRYTIITSFKHISQHIHTVAIVTNLGNALVE
jgi:hypothetical protein